MNGMETQQIEQVRNEVLSVPERAKLITVRDQQSLQNANLIFLDIKALRKKIAETFDPIIQKAHAAHKEALNQKAIVEAPLILAEKYLNGQVTAYHQEIENKRREEEEVARQKAIREEMERRKKEEDLRLKQAAKLEKAGATEEAEALIQETIEENQKPIEIYVPPPETPKVELEGATVKIYWKAEIVNLKLLCQAIGEGKCPLAYVEANMTTLNAQARSLKKEINIPGVRAISTSNMAATGKR